MKRLVLMIIAVCILHGCKEKGYVIRGEISDADGLEVVLMKFTPDSEPVEINSCTVKKGKFVMKGKVDFPEYCVMYAGDNGPLQLFVENTAIEIAVDLEGMHESKITGSKETDLLMDFVNLSNDFQEKANEVNEEYMMALFSGETDEEKQNDIISKMRTLEQEHLHSIRQIAEENPNSIFTAILLREILLPQLQHDEVEVFANGFDEVNSKSPWVQMLKEHVETVKRLAVGQPFIDLTMPAPDGNEISLSDYAGKGNYLLIDFWASWCQPCRMANPHLVNLYNKYNKKGFEIVGISLDREKDEWIKAIEDDKLTWAQMSDLEYWHSEGAKLYAVTGIPHAVLLDKEGNILARGIHIDELEEKLEELLQE